MSFNRCPRCKEAGGLNFDKTSVAQGVLIIKVWCDCGWTGTLTYRQRIKGKKFKQRK